LRNGLTVEEAEKQGGISLFNSPYVNPDPDVVKDLDWYREAFPGDGRTLVASGAFSSFPSSSSHCSFGGCVTMRIAR
jgi:hypothetical protein